MLLLFLCIALINLVLFQTPQHESKDKKLKLFNSGTVAMDVNLEKTGFFQGESPLSLHYIILIPGVVLTFLVCFAGEGLKVLASIENNSSREIKPKYCVYRKHSFFARGKRRLSTKDLFKEVGEPIPPSAKENVIKVLPIPIDVEPSILNCSNIKVEYRLRVSICNRDVLMLLCTKRSCLLKKVFIDNCGDIY